MENELGKEETIDEKVLKTFDEIEVEKEQKLVNLIVRIVIKATLKEYYEKSN